MKLPKTFYPKHLQIVEPKRLYQYFIDCYYVDNCIWCDFKTRKANLYPLIKKLIEYEYGIPMPRLQRPQGQLAFIHCSEYATHRLLRLLSPYHPKKHQKMIGDIIEVTSKGRISMYAAGGIEASPDQGKGYRQLLKEHFEHTDIVIIDPCDFEYNKKAKTIKEYIRRFGLQKGFLFSKKVGEGDIGVVKKCDALVVCVDEYMGSGSIAECTIANSENIPVYGIVKEGFDLRTVSPWFLGRVDRYFDSLKRFREFMTCSEKIQC